MREKQRTETTFTLKKVGHWSAEETKCSDLGDLGATGVQGTLRLQHPEQEVVSKQKLADDLAKTEFSSTSNQILIQFKK